MKLYNVMNYINVLVRSEGERDHLKKVEETRLLSIAGLSRVIIYW